MDIAFHYPPELLSLLIDTIPRLCRSKGDVLLFFKGAGVPQSILSGVEAKLRRDKDAISKYEMTRTVLTELNQQGDKTLRERREVLKRVVEFENFSSCWPNDQVIAKGYVSEIQKLVNVKDSFTKMNLEREKERQNNIAQAKQEREALANKKTRLKAINERFARLFTEENASKRGKELEGVLNELFDAHGILVREAFALKGNENEGIVEQIDGVIEIDGEIYLVEMKWYKDKVGVPEISQHLVRVHNRRCARGIFISASEYTEPALSLCKESLQQAVFCLATLAEIYFVSERGSDLKQVLKAKIQAAIVDKNPYCVTIR